jgi:BirA family biotin operon repressor/biotin-[acetyl-CoA-carboxylase] ligase
MIDADQLRATTFVRHVEIHDTLGSTNDRAAELIGRADIELPALVIARHQTAGKGRGRNSWWSADGALTFSLVIDAATTGVTPASWPQLSLATAVAVCDALMHEIRECGLRIADWRRKH